MRRVGSSGLTAAGLRPLGYDRDEVLGHKSIDFLTDESRLRAVEDTLPLFWRAGAAHSVGYQIVKKYGEPLDISLDAEISYTSSGSPIALAALRDRVDTAQWRQASATIRALKEIADVRLELEAAISSEGGLLLAKPTSDPPPEADSDLILEPQGRLSVDLEYHRVTIDDKPVTLTPREWAMLRVLVKNAGRVIGPRQLLQEAWGPDYSNEVDYIRAYIARLRKKLEPDPAHPRYLLLERGLGYRLVLPD